MVAGDSPYAVPLNHAYRDGRFYFHCANSGRKLDAIGRDPSVPYVIEHPTMSRRHAEFHLSEASVVLVDLGSANGTYVRIRGRAHLRPGDYFRIGDEVLMLAGG